MQENNAYGNIELCSPDDILLCHINERKLNFYLKNNLVEKIGKEKYRLTFKPKGLGYSDSDRNYLLLVKRKNQCVVSGETNISLLTRHHIIPVWLRKHFPEKLKSNNFQLIVLIDKELHAKYTIFEHDFYEVILKKYNLPSYKETSILLSSNRIFKISNTILKNWDKIPKERFEKLIKEFEELTASKPTFENFVYYQKEVGKLGKKQINELGRMLVEKVEDLKEFEMMWLKHFIETMNPKFLPDDLQILLKNEGILF